MLQPMTTERIRLFYGTAVTWTVEERDDLIARREQQYAEFDAWLAGVKSGVLREAARKAVTEERGIPWDDDYDRATVAAWLDELADEYVKED